METLTSSKSSYSDDRIELCKGFFSSCTPEFVLVNKRLRRITQLSSLMNKLSDKTILNENAELVARYAVIVRNCKIMIMILTHRIRFAIRIKDFKR
jgi:hypothetical protein